MARDAKLSSPASRLRLKGHTRHWRTIHKGLALGYWRGKSRSTWIMRTLLAGVYKLSVIGIADDTERADGLSVFDFEGAQKRALALAGISTGPVTVAEAVSRYITRLTAAKGEGAAADARMRLEKHVTPSLGHKRVGELTLTELQRWRDDLVSRKVDPVGRATANRIMANLKAALNAVFKDDKNGIASDKAWRVLEAFKGATRARQDHFEVDQAQRLIDAARTFNTAFADLLTGGFITGARYGELAVCDVRHFEAKHGVLAVPSGKTGARPVTLTVDAIEFFELITKGRSAAEPLFRREDGQRWGKSHQQRPIKRALELAKLPASASFYSLRHSYISRSIEEDVPLFIIARNCGTSEKIIRQHYAKLLASKERAMLERAAKALRLRVVEGGRRTA